MAGSISQQLEDLLNPLPKFTDPEDDHDEETRAKVIDKFDEGEEDDGVALSGLRKSATSLLPETDRRYLGKSTSRKDLLKETAGSEAEDDDVEIYDMEEDEEEQEDEDEDDDKDEENDIHMDSQGGETGDTEEDDEELEKDMAKIRTLVSKMNGADLGLPKETDFHKLTEGMDDLGESEEDDSGEEDGNDGEEEEEEDEMEEERMDDDAIKTFSQNKVDEEVEKGIAVKNQLELWDKLLEGRIKIQKALVTANQIPQPHTFPEFKKKGGDEFAGALKKSHKALKALQRSLLELQDHLLYQSPDTSCIAQGRTWGEAAAAAAAAGGSSEDEEILSDEEEMRHGTGERIMVPPAKRKLEMADYPKVMATRCAAFRPYRDTTLQKWHDKTRLTMGKSSKGFGAFERNILTQVEQVLMDKERLLVRTQTRRTEYRVLGKPEAPALAPSLQTSTIEGKGALQQLQANAHLKELDPEIFDDDDFYHQLLRELIERRTSTTDPNDHVAMGRQWLAIQKLRSKIKKKVDTKASKGRKVRFHIHSKLVNFMAPMDQSSLNDEARTELFRSLFGKNACDSVPCGDWMEKRPV